MESILIIYSLLVFHHPLNQPLGRKLSSNLEDFYSERIHAGYLESLWYNQGVINITAHTD